MHRLDRPHHDGSPLYLSHDAPPLGATFRVRVRVPHAAGVDEVHLRTTHDAEPTFVTLEPATSDDVETWWECDLTARNPVTHYRFLLLGGVARYRWLTAAGIVDHDVPDDTDFRVASAPPPPAWVADAILYQIFPDRFARSGRVDVWPDWAEPADWDEPVATEMPRAMRQLYGGDLYGIVDHLDHLHALGVTGIYLTPVFPATENHRYCATDFARVDPVLGGDGALVELTSAAHGGGLKVLGDLTVNHSGDQHPWFVAAQADPDGVEAGFYHWIRHPDDYEGWAGVPSLPKFDHRSAELRRRLVDGPGSVAARWLEPPVSLDGWRVDAANVAGRCGDVDVAGELVAALRRTAEAVTPDAYLLAEHCHDASADLQGDGWHGTMNYVGFTRPVWQWLVRQDREVDFLGVPGSVPRLPGSTIARTVDAFAARIPWRSRIASMNLVGSHDTARWRHVAGERGAALVGLAMLLTFPGVPSLYAGDELGLAGHDDKTNREPMPWHDPARWDEETLTAVRALVRLRRDHPALRTGGFRWVAVDDDVLVYLREDPAERLLVQVSRAPHPAVMLPADLLGARSAEPLLEHPGLAAIGGGLALPTEGPAHRVWRLG